MNRNFLGMNLNVTMILIIINMLVFLLVYMLESTKSDIFLLLPLFSSIELTIAHPWTLITSMFMHDGIMHFFMNMVALFFVGNYIESILKTREYLLVYLAGGIVGGLFFILFSLFPLSSMPLIGVSQYAASVGASGAIFAIFTALAVLRPYQKVYLFPFPIPLTLPMAVVIAFLVVGFLMPNVANSAHLGGIVAGAICGYYFKYKSDSSRPVYEYDEYGNIYRY